MKTIIAGSRGLDDMSVLQAATAECGWRITCVVSGTARGADRLGELWAHKRSLPVERYPADWTTHGKAAGYRRNELMAQNAEALIALWDGESRGTKHMIDIATRRGLKVYVKRFNGGQTK